VLPLLVALVLLAAGVLAVWLAWKRMSRLRWRVLLFAGAAFALCASLWACNLAIPFNLADTKVWGAHHLRDDVKDWSLMGRPQFYGRTNSSALCYLARSNIVCGAHAYTSVMRLDSDLFRGRGYLVATEDQKVFWIDGKGRAEMLNQ
jgi:hypothetical protein